MSLEIGIVGLPNVGKSTLFNALTDAGAEVANYPFTTIEPNVGVVALADARLDFVASLVHPQKTVPSTVRFVDIAGLVRGAHRGEGLGNEFLGHIRSVDAIAMVVRCFNDENVAHVDARLDPLSDVDTVWLELTLADVEVLERRIEKVASQAKASPKQARDEMAWLEELRGHLEAGGTARSFVHSKGSGSALEAEWLAHVSLLTAKPTLYVANTDESDLPEGGDLARAVRERAQAEGVECVVLCAQTEMELLAWPDPDAAAYRADLGLEEPGLQQLVRAGYRLLDLITFITATGTKAVQSWAIPEGTLAPQAAGKIHSDIERGFIRAEVVAVEDLRLAGSFARAKEQGKLRVEGKSYVVHDGDVVHFRFNV